MTYEILETCMLAPGFTRGECASWVQAWGSIVAILAAIGVAWWQRHQDRAEAAGRNRVRAEVAGTAVLMRLDTVLGGVAGTESDVRKAMTGATLNIRSAFDLLTTLPYPTDDEILALADHDHLSARLLVRGKTAATGGADVFRMLSEINKWPSEAEWEQLADRFAASQDQFRKARERLMGMVPMGHH